MTKRDKGEVAAVPSEPRNDKINSAPFDKLRTGSSFDKLRINGF
jgi:hypothetical protein